MTNIKTKSKSELFEGTPVVFTPLKPGGKHPELVVVDLRDLIEASERHRTETALAYQAGVKETAEEIKGWVNKQQTELYDRISKEDFLSHLSSISDKV